MNSKRESTCDANLLENAQVTHPIRDDVVLALVATGKWSVPTARVSERAGHRCEYCDLDLLSTPEAYKLFEIDHIVPLSSGGHPTDLENLALSRRHCNVCYKRRWDPRRATSSTASRAELVAAARKHIAEVRATVISDLDRMRQIIGYVHGA
jgi:5-methylcytosine-specific restriction endonuclease McrA